MPKMKLIHNILTKIIKPFYWSGIWNYFPFKQINAFYKKISKNEIILKEINYWFKMFLSAWRVIDDQIKFSWVWEKHISELLKDNLKEWDIFLDLGANIWYDSLLASKLVWETWKVISFEPNKDNFQKLSRNIEVNNFKNIQIYKFWVWKEKSKFELFYDESNPGATSIIKRGNHNDSLKETIEVVKLDDFLKRARIDFIKMDIEWFEYDAILWMKNILKENNLKIIFEYSPIIYKSKEENYENYSINILNELNNLWFELYNIELDSSLSKIENNVDYFRTVSKWTWQSDIFCKKSI